MDSFEDRKKGFEKKFAHDLNQPTLFLDKNGFDLVKFDPLTFDQAL